MSVEAYREKVFTNDREVMDRALFLVVELTQQIKDEERQNRIVTLEALRGYLAGIALRNEGMIPVKDMHQIIDDVLVAEK